MYPTISYTFHISVCLCIGLLFWFYKGEGKSQGSTYRVFLRILAIICFISAAMSAVMLNLHLCGIDGSFMGFASAFFSIITAGLYFRPFLLNLRLNTKLVQWQDGFTGAFVALGLVHPLLYYHYLLSRYSEYSPSLDTYKEFLQTPECEALTIIVYVVGALYLLLSLYNTFRHLRIILLWDRQHKGKNAFFLAIQIFFFLFFAFLLMIFDAVLYGYCDCPYYADLPLWAAFIIVAAISILNCEQRYIRLEHEGIRLQIEFAGARLFYQKSALALGKNENIHHREQAVVLRALSDWAARTDHPFLKENLTICSLSEDIGIPETVIIRYLNSSYGLSFEEYIGFLTSQSTDDIIK